MTERTKSCHVISTINCCIVQQKINESGLYYEPLSIKSNTLSLISFDTLPSKVFTFSHCISVFQEYWIKEDYRLISACSWKGRVHFTNWILISEAINLTLQGDKQKSFFLWKILKIIFSSMFCWKYFSWLLKEMQIWESFIQAPTNQCKLNHHIIGKNLSGNLKKNSHETLKSKKYFYSWKINFDNHSITRQH